MTPAEAEFRARYRLADARIAAAGAAYAARKAVTDAEIRREQQKDLTRRIEATAEIVRKTPKIVEPPRPSAQQIIMFIAAAHGWSADHLLGPSRCVATINARHRALREVVETYPEKSMHWVGRQFHRDGSDIRGTLASMGIYRTDFGKRKLAP